MQLGPIDFRGDASNKLLMEKIAEKIQKKAIFILRSCSTGDQQNQSNIAQRLSAFFQAIVYAPEKDISHKKMDLYFSVNGDHVFPHFFLQDKSGNDRKITTHAYYNGTKLTDYKGFDGNDKKFRKVEWGITNRI